MLLIFSFQGGRQRPKSRARVYADVNPSRSPEYYSYDSLNLAWG